VCEIRVVRCLAILSWNTVRTYAEKVALTLNIPSLARQLFSTV